MREYERLDVRVIGVEDDVVEIALSNPDRLNVVDGQMHHDLARVFRDVEDFDPRVVVLTGAGDEAFSAGGDLEWMQDSWISSPAEYIDIYRESKRMIEDLVDLPQPVIARVNGDAAGLGATLALHCDIVVAAESARIGDPHVNVGLSAGDGGASIWPLLTSFNKAKEYLMTGELIPATEAEELGLVNHVVPDDELDEKVEERIDTLTSLSQPAVRFSKVAANAWLRMANEQILRQSLALEGLSAQAPDHAEAVAAFLEDREPDLPSARSRRDDA
jgi:enoyl-CoA hydratase